MNPALWIPIWAAAARKKVCPYCKARNDRKARYCIECGNKLPPEKELSENERGAIVAFVSILVIIICVVLLNVSGS
jgi:ribosomal protein L40E